MTVTVNLDYLAACQLIAAGEARIALLEVRNDPDVAYAITQTRRGVLALRQAAGLTDLSPEALEARQAVTVAANHDAMAGWSESELREAWGR